MSRSSGGQAQPAPDRAAEGAALRAKKTGEAVMAPRPQTSLGEFWKSRLVFLDHHLVGQPGAVLGRVAHAHPVAGLVACRRRPGCDLEGFTAGKLYLLRAYAGDGAGGVLFVRVLGMRLRLRRSRQGGERRRSEARRARSCCCESWEDVLISPALRASRAGSYGQSWPRRFTKSVPVRRRVPVRARELALSAGGAKGAPADIICMKCCCHLARRQVIPVEAALPLPSSFLPEANYLFRKGPPVVHCPPLTGRTGWTSSSA